MLTHHERLAREGWTKKFTCDTSRVDDQNTPPPGLTSTHMKKPPILKLELTLQMKRLNLLSVK